MLNVAIGDYWYAAYIHQKLIWYVVLSLLLFHVKLPQWWSELYH